MKFTCKVEIEKSIENVCDLFNNPDNLKEWQDGFQEIKHISGTPGETGAVSELRYLNGKREIVLTETILTNSLPNEFTGKYEAKEMVNTMKNTFEKISDSRTLWNAEIEYSEFRGFMPKLLAKLFPGLFKKQVQKWLNQFKAFAEKK